MTSRILIIEDEKPNADRLIRLIKAIKPKATVLAVLDTVADAIDWFKENEQPDVVMMDVRLHDGVSFEIFDNAKVNCPIIFTTAYEEYAVRAFKYYSIDYLLKPVQSDELKAAFEKLEITFPEKRQTQELLKDYFQPQGNYRERFLLPYRDGYKTLLVNDVILFSTEAKIARALTRAGKTEVLPQTMEELEQQLNPRQFFRANRQFIIHIDAVKQLQNYFNGKLKVEIKDNPDIEIIVSRDKANLLKSWMDF